MFLLWIGDRISMKGIGNGISMIIAAGIIARLPHQMITAWETVVDTSSSSATSMVSLVLQGIFYVIY